MSLSFQVLGGNPVAIKDAGTTVVSSVSSINFTGTTITNLGGGAITVAASGGGGGTWGSITGTLSSQTDLQNALNLKANLVSPSFTTPTLGVATATSLAASGAISGSTGTFSSTTSILLGTAGSAVGNAGFRNATSGTATLAPPTGALGTYTVTLPNAASTLPIFGQQITFAGPTAARTITLPDAAFTVTSLDGVQTLTNKRITQRVATLTDAATVTPDSDASDMGFLATVSQATQFLNPTGTPTNGQTLVFRLKSTAARALTWDTQYRGSTDLALPSTTTGSSKTDYLAFRWNSADTKWDVLATNFGF